MSKEEPARKREHSGLVSAEDMREHSRKQKETERAAILNNAEKSGRDASTIYRDKHGMTSVQYNNNRTATGDAGGDDERRQEDVISITAGYRMGQGRHCTEGNAIEGQTRAGGGQSQANS